MTKNRQADELVVQQRGMASALEDTARKIEENHQRQVRDAYLKANPVIDVCRALRTYIESFEAELDEEHEVGIRLASFGGVVIFHAEKIGFSAPNVITFYGVTDEGEKVQLIQHVSQLNFLLRAMKKLEERPTRIGFVWDEEQA